MIAALSAYATTVPCRLAACLADHGEERLALALAVDHPVGVEDLVAAVLGIRLREHGGVRRRSAAPHLAVGALEIFDLIFGEREPELSVRAPDVGVAPSGRGGTCSKLGRLRQGRARLRRRSCRSGARFAAPST